MSAPTATDSYSPAPPKPTATERGNRRPQNPLLVLLSGFASLKLTVVLMALAIAVIFIGTLAQTSADIWEVMRLYFRAWIMWVPLEVFFPQAFFPHATPYFSPAMKFPFPGGATVGSLMAINLFSAHLVRFKTLGKGQALAIGWGIIGIGTLLTAAVIISGNLASRQDMPVIGWGWMWAGMLVLMALVCAVSWCGAAYVLLKREQNALRLGSALALSVIAVTTSALLGYAVMYPEHARLAESSLRILWQQTQGLIAASVVLGGAWFVFRQRAGIVVLHTGIALLMLEQVVVAWHAVESQISLVEGETTNFSRDVRATELAFADSSDSKNDRVTVVGGTALRRSNRDNAIISNDTLPVNVRVLKYLENARLKPAKGAENNLATKGTGIDLVAVELDASTGVDTASDVDLAAAYVSITDKKTKEDLGTFLVSIEGSEVGEPETITVDGKKYEVSLRFKHLYKDYTVTLNDVRKDDYPGTDTPMNYSSDVTLEDTARNLKLTPHIWMNNPLRYAGETFYQSGYAMTPQGERTTLQVVSNTGWMIPYVALSFVFVGMAFHFVTTMIRFLDRLSREQALAAVPNMTLAPEPFEQLEQALSRTRPAKKKGKAKAPAPGQAVSWTSLLGPTIVTLLFFLFVGSITREKKLAAGDFDFEAFGRLPIVHEGRVKPLDTFARNELRIISNEESFKEFASEADFRKGKFKRQPAVKWFLDLITAKDESFDHKVFRIENQEVLSFFGVEVRPGFFRYSVNELGPKIKEFEEQLAQSRNRGAKAGQLSTYEKKLSELESRFKAYLQVTAAFDPPRFPPLPTEQERRLDEQGAQQRWLGQLRLTFEQTQQKMTAMKLPLVIPLAGKQGEINAKDGWQAYPISYFLARINRELVNAEPEPAVVLFNEIIDAYQKNDPKLFNQKVAEYQHTIIDKRQPAFYSASKISLESYFNRVSPFFWGIWIYVVAFLLSGSGILGSIFGNRSLKYSATTLIVLAFALHTAALVARLMISGRPPVTNLYSSAIFIGWGCVLAGICLEFLFRMGIGNLVASTAGYVTLLIASWLAVDGDTFTVLQAVLDTQFWLATHVTSITIGYSATFLAGLVGISLLFASAFMPFFANNSVAREQGQHIIKTMGKMVYGIVCSATFFSFVGTVLGGLWADDSWGRFWGWDPKENGALMIVLWNSLVLHARWDRQVGDRGLAVLAIGGNIITAWSWFGVNELGAGLHSYGFTEGRSFWLGMVVLAHLALMIGGTVLAYVQRARTPEAEAA